MQEWSDFTGMIGTIGTNGACVLHENKPERKSGDYVKAYYVCSGNYIPLPKELVTDCLNYDTITLPKGN